jgi:uncharacterized membrane protein
MAAALSFAGLHLFVSGTPLRAVLVRRLGEGPYRGLFSLASLVSLIWLARSYSSAYGADNQFLWSFGVAPHHAAAPIMLAALLLAVIGLSSPNPTSVGQEKRLPADEEPRGIQRVTRHPFLWGVIVWSAFHVFANGDVASFVLFSTFFVIALVGTFSIDRKRERALGDAYRRYEAKTSNVPFVALARGRTRFVWREIGLWRVLVTLAVFAAMVSLHPWLFGAYPLPGMAD